jgi:prolipoprotein diacylglyceryltransferase
MNIDWYGVAFVVGAVSFMAFFIFYLNGKLNKARKIEPKK